MDPKETLGKIEKYLQQQKEISGGNLYFEKSGTKREENSLVKKDFSEEEKISLQKTEEKILPGEKLEKENFFEENFAEGDEMAKRKSAAHKNTTGHFKFPDTSDDERFTVTPGWEMAKSLDELKEMIENCQKCPLGKTRTNFVFGSGNPDADLVVIGEAPGADEDMQGLPFVGRAGQMLTKILESVNFSRDEVYICNIIKSRPPNNRRPAPNEVEACEPYLWKQLELIKPQFILALGLTAVNTLFREDYKMAEIRGKLLDYHGVQVLATYHPAALLRNPQWKRAVWEDVQALRRMYDEWQEKSGKKK